MGREVQERKTNLKGGTRLGKNKESYCVGTNIRAKLWWQKPENVMER